MFWKIIIIVLVCELFYILVRLSNIILLLNAGKVIIELQRIIDDFWVSYSVKEITPLLTTNGLKGVNIEKMRTLFIQEIYSFLSNKYKFTLRLYFTKKGLITYIGKTFDRRLLPLWQQSLKDIEKVGKE